MYLFWGPGYHFRLDFSWRSVNQFLFWKFPVCKKIAVTLCQMHDNIIKIEEFGVKEFAA